MTNSLLRPATAADIRAWYGKIPYTMQAMILEIDGKPVGIGGLARQDLQMVAFMDIKPEAKKYPVTLVKATRKVMDEIVKKSIMLPVASPDQNHPNARRFLEKMGFEKLQGDILVCRH